MKKIALIHDLSGFGKCSLTAAIPVISVMGCQACPLPTAVLSSQTGFKSFFYDDYTDKIDLFTCEWKKITDTFDGIYSGFLGSPAQIEKVLHFIDEFKNNESIVLIDPVMGDQGRTIKSFSKDLLSGMQLLVSKASITTPNLTELCLLTGVDYFELNKLSIDKTAYLSEIEKLCRILFQNNVSKNNLLNDQTILVTGILREHNQQVLIGNLAVTCHLNSLKNDLYYTETPYTGKGFSGTGDLFASVICGGLVKGLSINECIDLSLKFLQPAILEATTENIEANHGVYFEKYLSLLIS